MNYPILFLLKLIRRIVNAIAADHPTEPRSARQARLWRVAMRIKGELEQARIHEN